MTLVRWLRRASLPGLVGLAVSASSGDALAAFTYSSGAVVYATQAITTSTNVTLPGTSTITSGTLGTQAIGSTTSAITLALPSGGTFQSTPTLSCTDTGTGIVATCTATTLASPVGANTLQMSITYTVTTACTATCVITLNVGSFNASGLQLNNATTSNLQLKATTGDTNFLASQVADFAKSVSALTVSVAAPAPPKDKLKIDVGTTALGKQFTQGGTLSLVGDLGAITFAVSTTANDATGATPFNWAGFPATATLSGNFTNIASAYIAPATTTPTTTCASTPPSGATNGTVTGSSITFANIPLTGTGSGSAQEVCIIANGTGIIGQNVAVLVPTVTAATTNPTSLTPGTVAGQNVTGALSADPYSGTVVQVLYSGSFASYPMFVRVVNSGGSSAAVTAVVQPEAGAAGVGTVVSNLAGGANTLVPISAVITNSGVTLDISSRASLFLLSSSATVAMEQLLMNPGGILVHMP